MSDHASDRLGEPTGGGQRRPITFGFLLVPQFTLTSFAAAVDCLRAANRVAESQLCSWRLLSEDMAVVPSSSGVEITVDQQITSEDKWDVLIVCSGFEPEAAESKKVLNYVRRLSRFGSIVGGIESGAHLLAAADVLNSQDCTIHWELFDGFVQRFPDAQAVTRLFVVNEKNFTCGGHLAVVDLMIALLSRWLHNTELSRLSSLFMHDIRRSTAEEFSQVQSQELSTVNSEKVLKAIEIMRENIETVVDRHEIADYVGVSLRQLERLFNRHLGLSPASYYKRLRLNKAKQLLHYSSLSITEIAIICGFTSMSHFSKSYREFFGISPKFSRKVGPIIGGQRNELRSGL
ncbi:GlxA family transcriptional regulator [Pelagibius sp. Alg239-R121]|uniref:GlxA family transcriptional regulator n=1 Tax=Pelagibius sp. Alg239-R121 TaxID=2993448 RepID=UPI0024A64F89|nr:GlxA family transcriptional regulator [Pelagibius sp. Alg239-R121]